MLSRTNAQKQAAHLQHVGQLLCDRDASTPGSPEEYAAAEKILEVIFVLDGTVTSPQPVIVC
jgi:hypothetical protein